MTNWGHIIRDLMKKRGITQRDLEALSGVNRSTIKRCLNGRSKPRIEVLEKLLPVFGYSISMGMTHEPYPLPPKQKISYAGPVSTQRKLIKAAGCDRRD